MKNLIVRVLFTCCLLLADNSYADKSTLVFSVKTWEGEYPQLFAVPTSGGEPTQWTKLDGAVFFLN